MARIGWTEPCTMRILRWRWRIVQSSCVAWELPSFASSLPALGREVLVYLLLAGRQHLHST